MPLAEFGEEPLRSNLNDLDWLERVARAHERVLEAVLAAGTIVPLRLCTIYENEASVRRMLQDERESLGHALELLDGRQEWGSSCSRTARSSCRPRKRAAMSLPPRRASPKAAAYMLRRRQERQLREAADGLAAEVAEDVHARLQGWATDAVTRPPQNRDLSGHEGDMLLNAAYLVPADRVDGMRELVAQLEKRHQPLGVRLELTGPWPCTTSYRRRRRDDRMSTTIAEREVALIDLVDRLLGGGVVIAGDITLAVADVDLVYVSLRALVSSVATAEEKQLLPRMGMRCDRALRDHRPSRSQASPGRAAHRGANGRARRGLRAGGLWSRDCGRPLAPRGRRRGARGIVTCFRSATARG